ncbi:phosphoglycerate mutase, partial [Moesziomyces antarcticus T-34]
MINFFGGKAPAASSSSSKPASSAASATPSPSTHSTQIKKAKPSAPAVTVTTIKKKVAAPPKPSAEPRDPIAALSGYNSKNALPEEKRRRIIEERLAAQRQKSIESSLEAQLRAPVKSSASSSKSSSRSKPKPKPKRLKKRRVDSDSDSLSDDDLDGGSKRPSRLGSSAPSTPCGSKRASVDPHPHTDSYQKVGREGVLPNYTVPRDMIAPAFAADSATTTPPPTKPISSADIVASNFKSFGPYFHGLGDAPRATLQYPGPGASEEFLLLVPKDADEYDPLMELLATVRAIVTHYLTPQQRTAFGSLDSLEVSNNAGMILPSATNPLATSTSSAAHTDAAAAALADATETGRANGVRAKSADLLDTQGSKATRRDELIGGSSQGFEADAKTPEPQAAHVVAHTAPVSPSSAAIRTRSCAP